MNADDGINALMSAGQQIVQNSGVQNAVQNLGKSIFQGSVGIGSAAGGYLIGSGTVTGVGTAIASAGTAISTAAGGVGAAILTAAASPVVIAAAVIGGGILLGIGIKKLFE